VLKLEQIFTFAEIEDEEELKNLLAETGMKLAGEAAEHVLLKVDSKIMAVGRLLELDDGLFHLLVFAVIKEERGKGVGGRLIGKLSEIPWNYCRESVGIPGGSYLITTVARGQAVTFYKKYGYEDCDFSLLILPFDKQCETCPDKTACSPQAMVFSGTIPGSS
jgi:GNAT superfamily N-acetyltransferase